MRRWMLLLLVALATGCVTQPVPHHALAATSGSGEQSQRQLVITIRDSEPGLRSAPGSTSRAYSSSLGYQASSYARRVIASLERDYPMSWVAGWRIDLLSVHCAVFAAHDRTERDALLGRLRQDARIESAQPMNTFETSARGEEYNDPYFSLQKGIEQIQVPEAHLWSQGRGITVAVIDTGVDTAHPELAGRVQLTRNFVDSDERQFRLDRHGTAVAGVIAALTNNGQGIIGVAPAAELFALKACWQQRAEAPAVCNTLTLAEALTFAIQRRARIINLSLTGPSDPLLTRLVARALEQGILVLGASAGALRNISIADAGFPISIPGVIAVADADEFAEGAGNVRGTPSTPAGAAIDQALAARPLLAAPGREVLTLAPGGRYDYVSGASISAAMVSGVVALVLERSEHLKAAEVRALLEQTGFPVSDQGTRIVNACDAVAALIHAESCRDAGIRTAAGVLRR